MNYKNIFTTAIIVFAAIVMISPQVRSDLTSHTEALLDALLLDLDADYDGEADIHQSDATHQPLYGTELNIDRGTVGDGINLREGSGGGDHFTRIEGEDVQDHTVVITAFNKPDYNRIGPPYIWLNQTADFNLAGQYGQWEYVPFTGSASTTYSANLPNVTTVGVSAIRISSRDDYDKELNPYSTDYICSNQITGTIGTWTCLSDGVAVGFTDDGFLDVYRRKDGNGWDVETSLTLTNAGAGCTGWLCGVATNANAKTWHKFENAAPTDDGKGSEDLTASGSPNITAHTLTYLGYSDQDDYVNLVRADNDYYTACGGAGDTDCYGWATSGEFTIAARVRMTNTVGRTEVFAKGGHGSEDYCFRINILAAGNLQLQVDDGNDGNFNRVFESSFTMVDGTWYAIIVSLDTATDIGSYYIYDLEAGIKREEGSDNDATNPTYGLDSASTPFYISETGDNGVNGDIDDVVIFDAVIGTTTIEQYINGTLGQ